jgi:hypothetical protein
MNCPAPSKGSGQGICKGSDCTIRCADGLTLCGDECVSLQDDGTHCGNCTTACEGGLVCAAGKCGTTCPDGKSACGASCADLNGDVNHCGSCDKVCVGPASSGAAACTDGKCSIKCDGTLSECEGACVDTKTDLENCGKCGAACAGTCDSGICCPKGQNACNDKCVDLKGDGANCGVCGKACKTGEVCFNGTCGKDCGSLTECSGSCIDLTTSAAHCGDCAKTCTPPPSNGTAKCAGSQCGINCAAGYAECSTGSCTNIKTDSANCGGCGKPCGGVCSDGVCCPAGQTNCSGKCVSLQTDANNCLTCGHVCAAGQVCEAGSCLIDCGQETRCGQTCADLSSDPYNCKICGGKCSPPAANGKAVCNGAAGCDIECNAGNLECAGACCDAPPANATAVCTNSKCAVQCKSTFHACTGTASPCYSNTDVKHCGSGCLDCTQPNAAAACNGTQCANTCTGKTLSCTPANGKPECGSWGFESGTVEGWSAANLAGVSSAWNGTLTSSTTKALTGTHALAIPFDDKGGYQTSGKYLVEVSIPVCSTGEAVTFNGSPAIGFNVFLLPGAGAGALGYSDGWLTLYNGNTVLFSGGDWDNTVNAWAYHSVPATSLTVTSMKLTFRIESQSGWKGTIFIDDLKLF